MIIHMQNNKVQKVTPEKYDGIFGCFKFRNGFVYFTPYEMVFSNNTFPVKKDLFGYTMTFERLWERANQHYTNRFLLDRETELSPVTLNDTGKEIKLILPDSSRIHLYMECHPIIGELAKGDFEYFKYYDQLTKMDYLLVIKNDEIIAILPICGICTLRGNI